MVRLASIGPATSELDAQAHRVYVAMLRDSGWTLPGLRRELHLEPENAEQVLDLLRHQGLVSELQPGVYEPEPPEVALRRLAVGHEHYAMRARSLVPTLTTVYQQARREREPQPHVMRPPHPVAPGPDAVQALEVLVAGARREIHASMRWGETGRHVLSREHQADGFARVRRSVTSHVVVDSAWDAEHASAVRQALRRQADVRISRLPAVPFTAVVADDHSAFLELPGVDEVEPYAFTTQDPFVVHALQGVVRALWAAGVPVRTGGPDAGPTIDLRVLGMLARGDTDRAIARQLELSVRTVERRVRTILDELGASTRFAAGCEAARRGLV